ncbi:MAG TPA: hypothetical protein VIN36_11600 [Thiobacillus sp.]
MPEHATDKALVFSGFLVDAGGVWFYITAGHILRDIRKSLEAGGKFDIWRLDDQTAGNLFDGAAIPFAFEMDKWLVIEDEEIGLDYAALVLDSFYCKQLEAGGVIPLSNIAWSDHVTEHDYLALVGIPSETISYDGETIIMGRVALMPAELVDEPATAGRKRENQFYARLQDIGDVLDIDGMSGGPIFAFKRIDDNWKYSVIGIQSAWYPSTQTIAACPFTSLGIALEDIVKSSVLTAEAV